MECHTLTVQRSQLSLQHMVVSAYAPWVNRLVECHNGLLVQTLCKLVVAPLTEDVKQSQLQQWVTYLSVAV